MNHQKAYDNIIEKAKSENRIKYHGIYYENHHIIPRCLMGSDDKHNRILLTAKEHYICHKLLTYIYPKNYKIIAAFRYMTFNKRRYIISSRDYAYVKELCKKWTKEQKENNPWLGNHHKPKSILKMKKPKTLETKQKYSKARKGKSYDEFYGEKSAYMKQKRKEQTIGSGNPNARKYLIHNSNLNKSWYCSGNLSQFCYQFHVSGRTLQLSRKNNTHINNWKCEYVDIIPENAEVF